MNKSIIYKATEDKDIQEDLRKLEALQKELKALEQEPCEDAISRQALLKLMGEEPFNWTDSDEELQAVEDYRNFRNMVEQLPSVNPQKPKTGHWVKYGIPRCEEQHYKCTACGYYINFGQWGDFYTKEFKYCPYCGAEMVEPQESEDKE